MERNEKSIFTKEEATAVVDSTRTLLVELPEEHLLSVDGAWRLMREGFWETQRRTEVIMRLETSLRIAHDN